MPAYNAAKTIKATIESIPNRDQYKILICDDGSQDETLQIVQKLGLEVIGHSSNQGYGANQKTLYNIVLSRNRAKIVVMLHPDNQYDASIIPQMIELIENNKADFVIGNRMFADMAKDGRMPIWKRVTNKILTIIQSRVYGVRLGEFHSGLRAYHRKVLESVNFNRFSDDFVFDSEMIASIIACGFKIAEIPVQVDYFKEASSINFLRSLKYGLETLGVLWRYKNGYYSIEGSPK
jgi:glycosyltransferase involved in cell wall biosynthesis